MQNSAWARLSMASLTGKSDNFDAALSCPRNLSKQKGCELQTRNSQLEKHAVAAAERQNKEFKKAGGDFPVHRLVAVALRKLEARLAITKRVDTCLIEHEPWPYAFLHAGPGSLAPGPFS